MTLQRSPGNFSSSPATLGSTKDFEDLAGFSLVNLISLFTFSQENICFEISLGSQEVDQEVDGAGNVDLGGEVDGHRSKYAFQHMRNITNQTNQSFIYS